MVPMNFQQFWKAKLERLHFFKVQSSKITVCVKKTPGEDNKIKIGQVEGAKCSQEGSFVANSEDCSTFLMCVFGEYISRPCGCGLHWDENIQSCNLIANANCPFGDGKQERVKR